MTVLARPSRLGSTSFLIMTDGVDDPRHRAYLVVTVDGVADGETVAVLLERAADRLRHVGKVDVQAVTYEQGETAARPSASLTVYYDRVERRRQPRD